MNTTVAVLLALMATLGCQPPERQEGDAHEHDPRGESLPDVHTADAPDNLLVIDPEMARDLRITTAAVEARTGGEAVTVLGELRVNEDVYAEVGSPVTARVLRLLASPGDVVRAGQPVAELQSVELGKAHAEYLAAKARTALARQTLRRKRHLGAERVVPQREVQEAEAEAAAAAAQLYAARAALRALGMSADDLDARGEGDASRFQLSAPIAGTILERAVTRGQMVEPARPLFRVADLSRLWLVVHAFERDAVRVKPGTPARITFPALPGRSFAGVVSLIGSQVDVASRTIPIRIDLANDAGVLRPGMSATAALPLADGTATVLAVPVAALQRVREGWCVFLPRGEGRFEVRPVGRGRDLGGEVEIVSGLRAGDTVVVDGAFLLKAEVEKARGAGGHDHEH